MNPAWELRARVDRLNRWFFEEKRFHTLADNGCVAERVTLHTVISNRIGSPTAIAMLYAFLAEGMGLNLELFAAGPLCVFRFECDGRAWWVDVARRGVISEDGEAMRSLAARPRDPLRPLDPQLAFIAYLKALRMAYRMREAAEPLLTIQNWILSCRPEDPEALGERALLLRRLGQKKSALADLTRYFRLTPREQAPPEIPRAYDELLARP